MKIIAQASLVLSLAACGGPSYPVGKAVVQAETTVVYYPKPEVAYTPENLAIIQKNGDDMKCNTSNNDGVVGAICGPTTYVVGKNGMNPKVVAVSCLGQPDPAGCMVSGLRLVVGTK